MIIYLQIKATEQHPKTADAYYIYIMEIINGFGSLHVESRMHVWNTLKPLICVYVRECAPVCLCMFVCVCVCACV